MNGDPHGLREEHPMTVSPEMIEKAAKMYGDPLFHQITKDEVTMYNAKNRDYAAGGEDPNGNFNRVAKFLAMYPGLSLSDPRVVCLTYMLKQLDQVLWSISRGYEGIVEGLDPRFTDIHIYTKIARVLNQHMAAEKAAKVCPVKHDPNQGTYRGSGAECPNHREDIDRGNGSR